ncbi:MAG: hypothetical protein M1829_000903 [Trizodia sp. TS-e1964]|nr:MAG: hypothetical protein M1829_000903 [Trizodia sp. TS-e1964]
MPVMLLQLSLLTSVLAVLALASRHATRDKPEESCGPKKLYDCLQDSPASASSFCNSVLGTSTITAQTVTPYTTVTSSFTVVQTQTTNIQTTTTSTLLVTSQAIQTSTIVVTTPTTTTTKVTSATLLNKKVRRDDDKKDMDGLSCATKDPYPSSQLSSACSCLYTRFTITVTPTAATQTVVSLTTASQTVTKTVVSTLTVSATTITTTVFTSFIATTTASVATSTVISGQFTQAALPNNNLFCNYRINYSTSIVPLDPGPDKKYTIGLDACRDTCAADSTCQFFLLAVQITDMMSKVVGQLGHEHFDVNSLDCTVPGHSIGYNRVD